MKWSWRVGQVAGIGIYVHATFLLLLLWVGWIYYQQGEKTSPGQGLPAAVTGIALILSVFGCVLLHELGHALTAKRYGIRTRDITLLPIGGLARLERMPDDPRQELIVALAGPAVNVVITLLLFPLALGLSQMHEPFKFDRSLAVFLWNLVWINVGLVVFNLLPAFPMDGGRVLRAALAHRLDYVRATRIAASIGQAMAFLFATAGLLMPQPMLVLIAVFVFLGAAQEASAAEVHAAMTGLPVRLAMLTRFRTLSADDHFRDAVAHLLEGSQQDFPVVEDGRVVGVLTRRDLLTGLAEHGPEGLVRDAMQTSFGTVDDREMLEAVFQRMQTSDCQAVPVLRGGQLVGMVTMDNIGEFLMVQSALRKLQERDQSFSP